MAADNDSAVQHSAQTTRQAQALAASLREIVSHFKSWWLYRPGATGGYCRRWLTLTGKAILIRHVSRSAAHERLARWLRGTPERLTKPAQRSWLGVRPQTVQSTIICNHGRATTRHGGPLLTALSAASRTQRCGFVLTDGMFAWYSARTPADSRFPQLCTHRAGSSSRRAMSVASSRQSPGVCNRLAPTETSGMAPEREPRIGLRQAMASTSTMPNCSCQVSVGTG